MSLPEDQFDDDLDEQQPDESSVIRQLRRQTKQQADELKALKEQAEQAQVLQKKVALYDANLGSLNEHQQKAILATSQEMTAEALRSQAELLGFVEPPAPAAPVEDIQAFDRVAQATAGGGAPDAISYETEVAAANSPEELRAVMARHGRAPEIIE